MINNDDKINEIEENQKADKSKWIYPVIVIVLIAVIIVLVIVLISTKKEKPNNSTGNNSSNGSNVVTGTNVSDKKYSSAELEKNITSNAVLAKDGTLVVFITNKNNVPVDVELEVEFYDANGNILGIEGDYLDAVGSHTDIVFGIRDFTMPNNWDNYKLFVDVEQSDYTNYNDKVSVTHNTNDDVIVQVTNNTEEEIDEINVAVVFYSGDTVVGYRDDLEYHTKPGRSANFEFTRPYDSHNNDLNYDSYKVYVNSASNY